MIRGRDQTRPGPLADERGSSTVELVLVTPLLVVVLLLMVLAGRLVVAGGEVEAAARDAARAASQSPSPQAAAQAARTAAATDLAGSRRVTCTSLQVSTDTNNFLPRQTPEGALPGTVTVDVRCDVRLTDLSLLGLHGTRVAERRAVAPVDAYRQVG